MPHRRACGISRGDGVGGEPDERIRARLRIGCAQQRFGVEIGSSRGVSDLAPMARK
jgi:hypothetical protein